MVHLELLISPRIFEKIRNGHSGTLRGLGKLIHEKTRSRKSRDTVPLSPQKSWGPQFENPEIINQKLQKRFVSANPLSATFAEGIQVGQIIKPQIFGFVICGTSMWTAHFGRYT